MAKAEIQKKLCLTLQQSLPDIRKIAGWTAQDLAELLGVARQTIGNWESVPPRSKITYPQYLAIRALLNQEIKSSGNKRLGEIVINRLDSPFLKEMSPETLSTLTAGLSLLSEPMTSLCQQMTPAIEEIANVIGQHLTELLEHKDIDKQCKHQDSK